MVLSDSNEIYCWMELLMNFDYATVVFSVQKSANSTFGDYAKYFVENQDFKSLESLIKLSNETNAFLSALSLQPQSDTAVDTVIDAIVVDVADDADDVADDVQPVKKVTQKTSRQLKESRIPNNQYSEIKTFIKNYLFERGGQAFFKDIKRAYYLKFKDTFTTIDNAVVSGSLRWSKRFSDQVGSLRDAGEILPYVSGTNRTCTLSPKVFSELAKKTAKTEQQLNLPDMWV